MGSSLTLYVPVIRYTNAMFSYINIPGFTGFIVFLVWMFELVKKMLAMLSVFEGLDRTFLKC